MSTLNSERVFRSGIIKEVLGPSYPDFVIKYEKLSKERNKLGRLIFRKKTPKIK